MLALPLFCQRTQVILKGDSVSVLAPNGLKLRAKSDLGSEVLHVIAFGKRLKVLDIEWNYTNSSNQQWILVEYQNLTGYVSANYLGHLKMIKVNPTNDDCQDVLWLERLFRYNVGTLVYSSEKLYKGYDADGKDSFTTRIEIFDNDTEITTIYGYESTNVVIETRLIDLEKLNIILEYWISNIKTNCEKFNKKYNINNSYIIENNENCFDLQVLNCDDLKLTAENSLNRTIISYYTFDL
jgi:hypothetical protein